MRFWRGGWRAASIALVAAAACKFTSGSTGTGDGPPGDGRLDGRVIDARVDAPIDAPLCTGMSASCSGDELTQCAGIDEQPVVTMCGWGCSTTPMPHCEVLTPTGGAVMPPDTIPSTLDPNGAFVMGSGAVVDSDAGTISNPHGSGTAPATRKQANVTIFYFGTLTIAEMPVMQGSNIIAFVADHSITVSAVLDLSGTCVDGSAGPGGGSGGDPNGNAANGHDPPGITMAEGQGSGGNGRGGGGAAYGGSGGSGGNISGGADGGGSAFGSDTIPTLYGGAGGGAGDNQATGGDNPYGGGGAGAIQLISNTQVTITDSGGVNVGGCGGENSKNGNNGGGGGGAAGTIVIEAPIISIAAGATLAANGGAGGGIAQGNNTAATSGLLGSNAAGGNAGGGNGGADSSFAGAAGTQSNNATGGGGGGVGRMRFNTRNGTGLQANGTLSPHLGSAGTTTTQGSASTQ